MTIGGRARLAGVDAARAVALAGMMAVHVLPATTVVGEPTLAHRLAAGRASALFAVLAGVGLALASGGARGPAPLERSGLRRGIAVRSLLVAAIGLTLGRLDSGLAVILAYYGVLFLLAIPVLAWGPRRLAALAVACALVTPVVSRWLVLAVPGAALSPSWSDLTDPRGLAWSLLVSGYYPVLTWSTYLFAGLAVGRCELARTGTAVRVAVTGGAAVAAGLGADLAARTAAGGSDALGAVLGLEPGGLRTALIDGSYGTPPTSDPWWLLLAGRHTGSGPDLAHTTGSALLVLGVCLLVLPRLPARGQVVSAVGAVPLTAYTLHVTLMATVGVPDGVPPALVLAGHLTLVVLVAASCRAAGRRGPLEAVVAAAVRRAQGPPRVVDLTDGRRRNAAGAASGGDGDAERLGDRPVVDDREA